VDAEEREPSLKRPLVAGPATTASNFGWIAWLIFAALGIAGDWRLSLLGGAIVMGIIVAIERSYRAVKIPDAAALVFFTGMFVLTMVWGNWLIAHYNVMIIWGLLAIVFWTTILIRFPFTLQFAHEMAPVEVWNDPTFVGMNYRISSLWAIVATVNSSLGFAMNRLPHPLIVGVAIPIALMIFAFAAGGWYGKRVGNQLKEKYAGLAAKRGESNG
jgi:MFS family permease